MPRYKLTIEYDGTDFVGWQYQSAGRSIQGELSAAIEKFSRQKLFPTGAGRTDAGVHAFGQVAHIDLDKSYPENTVRDAINFHLKPHAIAVVNCKQVLASFNARFSAVMRHYRYRIVNRRSPLVLDRNRAWQVSQPLDETEMAKAAQHLLGEHDFTTFRASQCQAKSPIRTLDRLTVAREGHSILIEASARSFLHHQIRSITGSLKLVGEGKWPSDRMRDALLAADRKECGAVAPPQGLYFMKVDYE